MSFPRAPVLSLVLAGAMAAAAPGAGASKRITGKLSKPGYTVIALAPNGKAKSVRTTRGKFRVRAPARHVTLHLRASKGKYAGPIVLASRRSGRRAIVGVEAGTRLGRIAVRRSHARVLRKLGSRLVTGQYARARKGVPIGVRAFGRVRSRRTRGGVPGDRDIDGIPNPLDIDDDGDRVLDNLDRSGRGSARQSGQNEFNFEFNLGGDMSQTLNANATGVDVDDADAFLRDYSHFVIERLPGDSAELDCGRPQQRTDPALGGLRYCTRGGTGRLIKPPEPGTAPDPEPFPECCDDDGDGFGTLGRGILLPRATSSEIGTGDVLIQRVTTDGAETHFASTLQYVFATAPALVSYSDTAGNCAKVSGTAGDCTTEFSYPVPASGPGTRANPFPVTAGQNGDVVVRLTFWRPQRLPIGLEPGPWTDVGGLLYGADFGERGRPCPQRAYSTGDDLLTPDPQAQGGGEDNAGGYRDLAPDQPTNPADTFTYRLNLSECLTAKSTNPGTETPWTRGVVKGLTAGGTDLFSSTSQDIHFERREG